MIIQDFHFKTSVGDKIGDPGYYFVGVALIVAYAANTESSYLPGIVIINLGNRDVEFISNAAGDGLEHTALIFQRAVLRDSQPDCTNTDVHNAPDFKYTRWWW